MDPHLNHVRDDLAIESNKYLLFGDESSHQSDLDTVHNLINDSQE